MITALLILFLRHQALIKWDLFRQITHNVFRCHGVSGCAADVCKLPFRAAYYTDRPKNVIIFVIASSTLVSHVFEISSTLSRSWIRCLLNSGIRSGGGTSTKTSVAAMGLPLFSVISFQPRCDPVGSEGAASALQGAVQALRVVSLAWSNAISAP